MNDPETILSSIVALIDADVALLASRIAKKPRALSPDESRRLALFADRLTSLLAKGKAKTPDQDMEALLERAAKIPQLADALRRHQKPQLDKETDGDGE